MFKKHDKNVSCCPLYKTRQSKAKHLPVMDILIIYVVLDRCDEISLLIIISLKISTAALDFTTNWL